MFLVVLVFGGLDLHLVARHHILHHLHADLRAGPLHFLQDYRRGCQHALAGGRFVEGDRGNRIVAGEVLLIDANCCT
jgi:hypothetical protein